MMKEIVIEFIILLFFSILHFIIVDFVGEMAIYCDNNVNFKNTYCGVLNCINMYLYNQGG